MSDDYKLAQELAAELEAAVGRLRFPGHSPVHIFVPSVKEIIRLLRSGAWPDQSAATSVPDSESAKAGPLGCRMTVITGRKATTDPAADPSQDLPGMLGIAKGISEQTWPHTMDAKVWADKWIEITRDKTREDFADHGWMLSWFANAIMAGYDTAMLQSGADPAREGR